MASLVITVRNEDLTIRTLLDSIAVQTLMPKEVIIVDGGSTDMTVNTIQKWSARHKKVPISIHIHKGNIAIGRNFAISHAKDQIIAVTDAGCILHPEWFEKITSPLRQKKADIAAGYYTPTGRSCFQKCLGAYTSVMPDRLNPTTFLPSSRSVAFTKRAWQKVGMYPEHLDTCEDLIFAKKLYSSDLQHVFVPDARVDWPQKTTLWPAVKQFYRYAVGDGQAMYIRSQTPLLFGRYIIGGILAWYTYIMQSKQIFWLLGLLIVAYMIWAIAKNYRYIQRACAFIYLPLLQISSDIAVIVGMSRGLIQYLYKRL